jgi:hypothetical protein
MLDISGGPLVAPLPVVAVVVLPVLADGVPEEHAATATAAAAATASTSNGWPARR